MRFDADKGDQGQVFDANGVPIPGAIRGDTETGLVESFLLDEDGNKKLNANETEFLRTIERHPAPLIIKPLGEPEPKMYKGIMVDSSGVRRISCEAEYGPSPLYRAYSWFGIEDAMKEAQRRNL